ncbi:energy-coupling factor ABC transporter ATP-binding protein [Pseudalkalibacillus hwajinpoensis]|uniref:Energy-coupling factor ABC transporter ATP-binding protein n=1 Tax=Guptibacillus hwajinpoensis TaxID=208199 RepID=A0A4U1M9T7_9BACL|nr:energy-coupling factor ABC transporter ATP-binding protein [Pseudalkalibacillus hwajinpoensis]TKD67211.1 energy-coupling factor ABC transporter ATP-binding protein [Pseudalkalibacillus hwajinpoensis]
MEELISVQNVSFRYQEEHPYVLKDVGLSVQKGEWLAIVGHNGSGKSTLARLLNGLLLPEKGDVLVEGFNSRDEESIWEIRRRVGIVFQNPDNQFVGTSVQDDVAFGLENSGMPREKMLKRIAESVKKVRMEDFLDQEPHRLSGGQKQRVAIAGIIALRPSIVILDEATSMLDPAGRKEVLQTMRELKEEEGMTVISITHDLEEAARADRMIVMNAGEVIDEGVPVDVFEKGDMLEKIGLDLPFPLQVQRALREKGYDFSKLTLSQEELVNELWTLQSKS